MRNLAIGMTASMLLGAAQGAWAETIITAQDYAVESDVVLESVVKEIKSAPRDTVNVIGDTVKYIVDETIVATDGVKAAFAGATPHEKAQKAGELAVENAWCTANDIIFRSYNITDEVSEELTQGAEIAPGSSVDITSAFAGIEFPEGTSAYLRPDFNKLMVRQTLENVLAIEDVLAEQHNASRELLGHQVEIQTKFVEVNQEALNELGFDWTFDSKHGGDASIFENLVLPAGQDIFSDALRTSAQAIQSGVSPGSLAIAKTAGSLRWSLVINALEQTDNSDTLSAPSIVTRDGSTASIQVGEERMVPQAFNADSQNTSVYIEHTDWDTALLGVMLEVTPELREGDLIDLEIKPTVKDLIGYDDYLVHPDADAASAGSQSTNLKLSLGALDPTAGGTFFLNELRAQLPYFRIREMETRVTVADGSTVGMGGLIYDKLETYKDKVPVLGSIPFIGRLFRSEGEKSIKRNLMIFVTATQVDVHGRKASSLALNK